MTVMTNTREIDVEGTKVICREMTVLQVRKWLADASSPADLDVVSDVLFSDCSLGDLKRMCDLSDETVDSLKPSQVQQVIDVCKGLNPHFFALLGRMTKAVQPTA